MEKIVFIKKFLTTFILSFIGFYLIERLISIIFNVDMDSLDLGWLGWLGFVIMYGFKTHIICCVLPFLFTTYKCRHKKCDHKHCDTETI